MVPDGEGGWISPTVLFQRDVSEVRDLLLKIMRGEKTKDRDKLMAANLILNRALGTPKQAISIVDDTDESKPPIDLGALPLDVLKALAIAARLDNGTIIDMELDPSRGGGE